jgi:hypothetical protein
MPKSAITHLEQQLEAIRLEAFAAGYAAAMEAIRKLASRAAPEAEVSAAAPSRRGRDRSRGRGRTQQAQPGTAKPTRSRRTSTRSGTSTVTRTTGPLAEIRTRRSAGRRSQRGTNALMIEEILKGATPNALRAAEIRNALQDKGVAISFASISQALGQLARRNAAEQNRDSKTWRATGGTPEPHSAPVSDAGPTG